MALSGSQLDTLADLAGLARVYTNAWGDEQPIADETLRQRSKAGEHWNEARVLW